MYIFYLDCLIDYNRLKKSIRGFCEYILVLIQYYSFCIKSGLNRLKMRKMKKRAERQIKNGDIYSDKKL